MFPMLHCVAQLSVMCIHNSINVNWNCVEGVAFSALVKQSSVKEGKEGEGVFFQNL